MVSPGELRAAVQAQDTDIMSIEPWRCKSATHAGCIPPACIHTHASQGGNVAVLSVKPHPLLSFFLSAP